MKSLLVLVLGCLFVDAVVAGSLATEKHPLTVIHTGGKRIDAQPYYEKISNAEKQAHAAAEQVRVNPPAAEKKVRERVSDKAYFPLTTTMMPGEPRQIEIQGIYQPFFVIGLDDSSLSWLFDHADALRAMNASGLVVEGDDWTQWRRVKGRAAELGISLSIQNGDALTEIYGSSTYPFLVVGK